MRTRTWLAGLGAALALVSPAWADWVVEQQIEGAGGRGTGTIRIKARQMRVDLPGDLTLLVNGETGETLHLQHRRKSFSRVSTHDSAMLEEQLKRMVPTPPPPLTPVGAPEPVLGQPAQQYAWQAAGLRLHIWITTEYPLGAQAQAAMDGFQKSGLGALGTLLLPGLKDITGLRIRTDMEARGKRVVYTISSVKEETVPPEIFAVPSGYVEVPFAISPEPPPEPPEPPAKPEEPEPAEQ